MKSQFHIGLLLSLSMVAMMLASACENDLDTLLQGGNCGPSCFLPMADLTGANLTDADLTGANLDGVIGADFSRAKNVPSKYLKD